MFRNKEQFSFSNNNFVHDYGKISDGNDNLNLNPKVSLIDDNNARVAWISGNSIRTRTLRLTGDRSQLGQLKTISRENSIKYVSVKGSMVEPQ